MNRGHPTLEPGASTGSSRLGSVLSALTLVASLLALGFFLGGFVATRLLPTTGMGWDQLADALGGMMLGTLIGLVLAVAGVSLLTTRVRWWTSAGALILAFVTLLGLRVVPPRVVEPAQRQPAQALLPQFEPAAELRLFVPEPQAWSQGHTQVGRLKDLSWRRVEVRTENWSAIWETHADPFDDTSGEFCVGTFRTPLTDRSAELASLVEVIAELPAELQERCTAAGFGDPVLRAGPELADTAALHLNWELAEQSHAATFTLDCTAAVPELDRLLRKLATLRAALDLTCEKSVGVAELPHQLSAQTSSG